MATDDITTITSACPCGKGTIAVTQSMPDHPWVRASQIHYSAKLTCSDCEQQYAVTNEWNGRQPSLVLRSDLEAKAAADAAVQEARKKIAAHPSIGKLKSGIAAAVDELPTKAAKHRLLGSLRLTHDSYSTFIKGPCTAEASLKWKAADDIVKAAHKLGLPVDAELLTEIQVVDSLQKKAWDVQVKTVPTNAHWMAA